MLAPALCQAGQREGGDETRRGSFSLCLRHTSWSFPSGYTVAKPVIGVDPLAKNDVKVRGA